ncbi:hypothetical protein ACJX0J_042323 [Zea mays]
MIEVLHIKINQPQNVDTTIFAFPYMLPNIFLTFLAIQIKSYGILRLEKHNEISNVMRATEAAQKVLHNDDEIVRLQVVTTNAKDIMPFCRFGQSSNLPMREEIPILLIGIQPNLVKSGCNMIEVLHT